MNVLMAELSLQEGARLGTELLEDIYSDLNNLDRNKLGYSTTVNLIAGKYEILTNSPISSLTTEFVTAYDVQEISTNGTVINEDKYYAIVHHNNFPARLGEILILKKFNVDNFIYPVEYGVCPIGINETMHFVTILPKVIGKPIRKIIEAGVKLDQNFILNKILEPLLKVLKLLHQSGITHGSINPDNIYINENAEFTLGNCISEICGYSQSAFYETVSRAQALKYGKGNGSNSDDYYSLGMTVFYLLTGKDITNTDDLEIIRSKLYLGTYAFLNELSTLNGNMSDLIKGLVVDNAEIRWSYTDVESLLQRRSYNINNVVDKSFTSRAIVFNGREHYSRRSLAHDLTANWDLAKDFVKTDKIKKWLEASISEEKVLEAIETVNLTKILGNKLFSSDDEKLIKYIIILDPEGPIRIKNVAFHKDGIGPVLVFSINYGLTDTTKIIANALFIQMFSIYESLSTIFGKPEYHQHLIQLNRCSDFIKRTEMCFGLERCIYDLNPTLPCQSHVIKNEFCIGVEDILKYIEDHDIPFEELTNKKNISCFIASKLGIFSDIKQKELDEFPTIQKSRAYQFLGLLATAQKYTKTSKLPNITETLKNSVLEVLNIALKSNSVKKIFFDKLHNAAKSQDLIQFQKMASNPDFIRNDIKGYGDAIRRGAEIAMEIYGYNNRSSIDYDIRKKSLKLAIRFSYVLCSFIVVTIILQTF
jgi:serine/threonine protein kinase